MIKQEEYDKIVDWLREHSIPNYGNTGFVLPDGELIPMIYLQQRVEIYMAYGDAGKKYDGEISSFSEDCGIAVLKNDSNDVSIFFHGNDLTDKQIDTLAKCIKPSINDYTVVQAYFGMHENESIWRKKLENKIKRKIFDYV